MPTADSFSVSLSFLKGHHVVLFQVDHSALPAGQTKLLYGGNLRSK